MEDGAWAVGLHLRSWLRKPGQQTGEGAAEVFQPQADSTLSSYGTCAKVTPNILRNLFIKRLCSRPILTLGALIS